MTAFSPGQSPPPVRIPTRISVCAEGGSRTHTELAPHRILSPARLPVPPLRPACSSYPPPTREQVGALDSVCHFKAIAGTLDVGGLKAPGIPSILAPSRA